MTAILQTLNISIPANRSYWTDTGVIVNPDESLVVEASGMVRYGPLSNECAFPEGAYDSCDPAHVHNPGGVIPYGAFTNLFIVTNTVPASLALILMPIGVTPSAVANTVSTALRPNRGQTFLTPTGAASLKVWAIFNDNTSNGFTNNSGAYAVKLQRTTDEPLVIDVGSPSPTRYVPPGMLAMKQSEEQCDAWMLALKPVRGPWEGYTSWDKALVMPEFADALGNVTPNMTYHPNISSVSNMPLHLKLDTAATDISTLAPKVLDAELEDMPYIFLDRGAVERRYYDGCYWEYFEVNPLGDLSERILWNAGVMGNAQLTDTLATIELSDYNQLANNDVGDSYNLLCQVGVRIGEEFGTHRCRNLVLNDGPLRADWTVAAVVSTIGWDTLRVTFGNVAQSGAALPAQFVNRLANGDLVFNDAPGGGTNFGYRANVKSGSVIVSGPPTVMELKLRLSLPYLPEIGDAALLTAGCKRTKAACIAYNNLPNGRFQELVGNDDLLRRVRIG